MKLIQISNCYNIFNYPSQKTSFDIRFIYLSFKVFYKRTLTNTNIYEFLQLVYAKLKSFVVKSFRKSSIGDK